MRQNAKAFTPVAPGNSYTDCLRNISTRFKLNDKFQIRAAVTTTRSRPDCNQLNPSTAINLQQSIRATDPTRSNGFRSAGRGNPDLSPLKSRNHGLYFEYCFSHGGSTSLALFHRDVQGFISDVATDEPNPTYGEPRRVPHPENGARAASKTRNSRSRAFSIVDSCNIQNLPAWAGRFDLQVNYSYIDAGAQQARPQLRRSAQATRSMAGQESAYLWFRCRTPRVFHAPGIQPDLEVCHRVHPELQPGAGPGRSCH